MSPGCIICDAMVVSGPAFLVLRGMMTGSQGFTRSEVEGLLCIDRQACLVRAVRQALQVEDPDPGSLAADVTLAVAERVDLAMDGMERDPNEDVNAKRLHTLHFIV